MENFFAVMVLMAIVATFVCFIGFIVKWITKKPKRRWGLATLISFILIWLCGFLLYAVSCKGEFIEIARAEPTCTTPGEIKYKCEMCGEIKSEPIDALGHDMRIISRIEPTETLDGEIVRQCSRCGYEQVEKVEKLIVESTEPTPPPANSKGTEEETVSNPQQEPESTESEQVDTSVSYEEIYRAYKENELRADDSYKNNRYQITAKINGMSTGGLFNLTGGATLTMEIRIDNTIVFFYAEFEKEQEDALKTISVGDTITFEGECLSAGTWVDCELIQ